jgi:S1-C subfamily serine protease
LDLAKTSDGLAYVLKLKELGAGVVNPASQCQPPLMTGDVIFAVNGKKCNNFMDTVNLIRAANGTIQLTFLR